MTSTPESLLAQLERRLGALDQARPDLQAAVGYQAALVREALTSAREPFVDRFSLPRERAMEQVRAGIPLLQGAPIQVDVHHAADLFSRLVNVVQSRPTEDTSDRVGALVAAATEGRLDPHRLFTEAFVQHHDHLASLALEAGVEPDLLITLALLAVGPSLRAYGKHLAPLLERLDDGTSKGAAWTRGYCPVCGAWPILGELRGVEQQRFLRCASCATAWRSFRMQCPYCRSEDFRRQRTLSADGERRFRLFACDVCQGYLKLANAFEPAPAELVPLEDAASIHLDLLAFERGYRRPGGTGYEIELGMPESKWAEDLASMD